MKTKFALGIALAALAQHAAALPITIEDRVDTTLDKRTGLEWLDVTATTSLSFLQVSGGAGGWKSAGWRHATGIELEDLFSFYVGTSEEDWFSGTGFSNALQLVRTLGVVISFNNPEGADIRIGANEPTLVAVQGFFDDGDLADSRVGTAELQARYLDSPGGNGALDEHSRWVVYENFQPANLVATYIGSFLVRREIQTVPEPASVWLDSSRIGVFASPHQASKKINQ